MPLGSATPNADILRVVTPTYVSAATTLTPRDTVIIVDATSAYTITMARAVEMAGQIVTFRLTAGAAIVTIAVGNAGDDPDAANSDWSAVPNEIGDFVVAYSDGICWYNLKANVT